MENKNKDNQLKHFTAIIMLVAVFVLGVYAWDARYEGMTNAAAQVTKIAPAAGMDEIKIGEHWSLVDHHGALVTQDDFSGQYRLVFFGFASCPDICPTTLQKITKALEILGTDSAQVRPLFITTDPGTDTPAVLSRYVSQFSSEIIGLTGT